MDGGFYVRCGCVPYTIPSPSADGAVVVVVVVVEVMAAFRFCCLHPAAQQHQPGLPPLIVELAVHVATEQRITDLRYQLLGNQFQSRLKRVGHLNASRLCQ